MKNCLSQRCLDRDFNALSIGSDPHGITITHHDWTAWLLGVYSSASPPSLSRPPCHPLPSSLSPLLYLHQFPCLPSPSLHVLLLTPSPPFPLAGYLRLTEGHYFYIRVFHLLIKGVCLMNLLDGEILCPVSDVNPSKILAMLLTVISFVNGLTGRCAEDEVDATDSFNLYCKANLLYCSSLLWHSVEQPVVLQGT